MKKLLFSIIILLSINQVRATEALEWKFIPKESSISFEAISGGSPVKGKFDKFSCNIKFDQFNLSGSEVKCSIDMGSVNTSYTDRDNTLKNSQWFNVASYPEAIFESTGFEFDQNSKSKLQFVVKGKLSIKSIQQDVSFPFDLAILKDKEGKMIATAEGKTTVKRLLFNIGEGEWKDPAKVTDDVKIELRIVAER